MRRRTGIHLGAAALVAVITLAQVLVSAAPLGPTRPSSFGASPLAATEGTNSGHWAWQKQELCPQQASIQFLPNETASAAFGGVVLGKAQSTSTAGATDGSASAGASGSASEIYWPWAIDCAFSQVVSDGYSVQWTRVWVGGGVPTKQSDSATATGSGTLTIATTAAASLGSSGSASASMSAAGGGPDPSGPTGSLTSKTISCDSSYDSAASDVGVGGNVGGQVQDKSAGTNASGHFSQEMQFVANGNGSATGSASYSVAAPTNSIDDALPNYTVTETGSAGIAISGTSSDPGSATGVSSARLNFTDSPS